MIQALGGVWGSGFQRFEVSGVGAAEAEVGVRVGAELKL